MAMQVKPCPRCRKLMWIKDEQIEYPDENTLRVTCPHCQQTVSFKLINQGSTATGPKMGH